jgi:hypothetical protein
MRREQIRRHRVGKIVARELIRDPTARVAEVDGDTPPKRRPIFAWGVIVPS